MVAVGCLIGLAPLHETDSSLVGEPVLFFPTRVLAKADDLEVNGFNVEGTWVLTSEQTRDPDQVSILIQLRF